MAIPKKIQLAGKVTAVQLQAAAADSDGPKWVMVAREGLFLGYKGGEAPFQFTRAILDQLVTNIQAHPSFTAGIDGKGTTHVVPWDFDHASARDATSGSKPASGSPAQGWTYDLEIREGAAGGNAELWALTTFMDPAKGYVKAGQYQWASVVVHFDQVDPVTAQPIGAVMSSIALTNSPFIEGMERLVASKVGDGTAVEARMYYAEASSSPMHAVSQMKELFGLKETDGLPQVFDEMNKLAIMTASGETPMGVDTEHLVGSLRRILNLPALSPESDVVVTAIGQLQNLLENTPDALASGGGDLNAGALAATKENETMEELIKKLAKALGVRETETAVLDAAVALGAFRAALPVALSISTGAGDSVVLDNAKKADEARAQLAGLFTALGVEDAEGSVNKIAGLMKQAAELEEVMPQLAAFKEATEKAEADSAEKDVDDAIAASKLPETMKAVMLNIRKSQGHDAFIAQFPKATPVAKPAVLSAVATTPTGEQTATPGSSATPVVDGAVDVTDFPGANKVAKAKMYLSKTMSGFDSMAYDDKMELVLNKTRSGALFVRESVQG